MAARAAHLRDLFYGPLRRCSATAAMAAFPVPSRKLVSPGANPERLGGELPMGAPPVYPTVGIVETDRSGILEKESKVPLRPAAAYEERRCREIYLRGGGKRSRL